MNSAIMPEFTMWPVFQVLIMIYTDGEIIAIKIYSYALTVVYMRLFTLWNHLNSSIPAGDVAWYFPSNNDSLHKE